MVALIAIASLAVDYGRVALAKTQLQRIADAAAMYGAQGAETGNSVAWAQAVAAQEIVDVYGPTPGHATAFGLQTGIGRWE
jgi:uncharacterized membrane protein